MTQDDVERYLPESYYLADSTGDALRIAARVTATCVARWADHYWARVYGKSSAGPREGDLPGEIAERCGFVEQVVDWLEHASRKQMALAALLLTRRQEPLLDAHDGLPGVLCLLPSEFAQMCICWEQHGLPPDLYYPAHEERTVVEPVEKYGGVIRLQRTYSPLEWTHRDRATVEALVVPTEEARRARFAHECEEFAQALMRRAFELLEPGPQRSPEESGRLLKLSGQVQSLAHRTRTLDERQPPGPSSGAADG